MNWFRTIIDGVAMSAVFNSYVAVSACQADINGFWPMFWTVYVEMMLILWPVLFCPAVGFIAAGIGMLIR